MPCAWFANQEIANPIKSQRDPLRQVFVHDARLTLPASLGSEGFPALDMDNRPTS